MAYRITEAERKHLISFEDITMGLKQHPYDP
jgi:hypothetical protein